jgi:hypothetical protein
MCSEIVFGSRQFTYCCLVTKDKWLGNLRNQRLFVYRINTSKQTAQGHENSHTQPCQKGYPESNNYGSSYEEYHSDIIAREAFEKYKYLALITVNQ